MRKRILSLILALCMVLSLLPATVFAAEETIVTVQVVGSKDYLASAKVHEQVNLFREAAGVTPLERNATLTELAMARAVEIALYYDENHIRPDGTDAETILDGVYEGYTAYGENIIITKAGTYEVLEELLASEENATNMRNGEYTQMGVGCFTGDEYFCWVQIFGNSTTNTETTEDEDYRWKDIYTVESLPSKLEFHPDGECPIHLYAAGITNNQEITAINQGFSECNVRLIPLIEEYQELKDESGTVVAAMYTEEDEPGMVYIDSINRGTVSVPVSVYEGQENPAILVITVDADPAESDPGIGPDPNAHISGTWGENLTWTLEGTVLSISGEGQMDPQAGGEAAYPWSEYRNAVTRLVIGAGITQVAESAFSGFSILESVELPDTLTQIKGQAFQQCVKLETVDLPDSVTGLGKNVFYQCSSLHTVRLSENLKWIPDSTFTETALTHVDLPDGITVIGNYAFAGCKDLKTVTFPDGLQQIRYAGFQNSGLTELNLPANTALEYYCFANCDNLESLVIPDGMTSLARSGFAWCDNLSSVTLPDSMQFLGMYCFEGCKSLKTIEIPDGVKMIQDFCFAYSGLVELDIPESVTEIRERAFKNCYALDRIKIPATSKRIFEDAFEGCYNLEIQCYYMTRAHVLAMDKGIACEILPEEPGTVQYPILIYSNQGGTVEASAEESPAERYVWITVTPDPGYAIESIYYQTMDGRELENLKTNGDTIEFRMPACLVAFEVTFINTVLPFVDVKETAYYYVPVMWALNHGITAGVDATHFAPDKTCTRAQVVSFLWRAAGCPEPTIMGNPFVDVKEGTYYYKAVLWAVENGITAGVDATHFGPEQACTRGQVVTFLWRACGKPEAESRKHPFTDIKETSFYYDAVLWAVKNGITAGVSQKSFAPDMSCTRGQIVSFLFRTFYG